MLLGAFDVLTGQGDRRGSTRAGAARHRASSTRARRGENAPLQLRLRERIRTAESNSACARASSSSA
ncbi:hypothetical protein C7S16_6733 [Burkholderia thailandensis]|uniref:Uncharacterized protein n=1 Tax=Burkholderia thailandensis TaxID=57975 RepID=A0AAW9CM20_BURTH|nr:hypothetical protein [Burkholderia thailandensis]